MDPNSTSSSSKLVADGSDKETFAFSSPSSLCTTKTSASNVDLSSEEGSDKQPPAEAEITNQVHGRLPPVHSSGGKADRYAVCPRTLTLDGGPTNIWYYRECQVSLIRRYDDRTCPLKIERSMPDSTCRDTSPITPGLGGTLDDNLHQAFLMGTTAKHEGVRKAWADSLVYSKKSAAGWTDVNLQELSRALVFRAIDSYEGPFDPLLDFILVLRSYFHNRLVNTLEHEVANIFAFTWKADSEESFMGDLYGLGLHIEALRHLVVHAGPSLWDGHDKDRSDSEIYMTAITQIVPSVLNGQPLYDFLPERSGRNPQKRQEMELIVQNILS
ncbi:hypothetical protein MD484_g1275, partial [Candolleomyces efflorescens]